MSDSSASCLRPPCCEKNRFIWGGATMTFCQCLRRLCAIGVVLFSATAGPLHAEDPHLSDQLIGFSELRTNLPGGRHANVQTMRAVVARRDGTGRTVLAEDLAREA